MTPSHRCTPSSPIPSPCPPLWVCNWPSGSILLVSSDIPNTFSSFLAITVGLLNGFFLHLTQGSTPSLTWGPDSALVIQFWLIGMRILQTEKESRVENEQTPRMMLMRWNRKENQVRIWENFSKETQNWLTHEGYEALKICWWFASAEIVTGNKLKTILLESLYAAVGRKSNVGTV